MIPVSPKRGIYRPYSQRQNHYRCDRVQDVQHEWPRVNVIVEYWQVPCRVNVFSYPSGKLK